MRLNDINPHARPYLIVLILLITALMFLLISCNPSAKIIKSEQIVRTNPESFDKIGKEWNRLNPCANDTTFLLKSDTSLVHDTTYSKHTDTLKQDTAFITNTKILTKTIVQAIVDRQKEKLDKDSIQALNVKIATLEGQIIEKDRLIKSEKERGNKWFSFFVIGIIVLIFLLGIKFSSSIKSIIPLP